MSHSVLFIPGGLASAFVQGRPLVCHTGACSLRYRKRPYVFVNSAQNSNPPEPQNGSDGFFSGLGGVFFGAGRRKPGPPANPAMQADLTTVEVPVISISPMSTAGNLIQVSVNVAATGLGGSHVAPGQFVQIGLPKSAKSSKFSKMYLQFVTIASPPGTSKDVFDFLINTKSNESLIKALRVGQKLRISPVMGRGLDYVPAASSSKLFIFVDNEQGLATAKSFVEFEQFRAASGNGAMRRTNTTIFYSVRCHKTMGYGNLFSKWLVFGVNVVPILGLSLLEYLSTRNVCGESGHMREHHVIICVSSQDTFEALRNYTLLNGLPSTAIQFFTGKTIAEDALCFDNDDSWRPPPPKANPFSSFDEMRREKAEKDSWSRWVKIRNSMKEEFERKWAAQSRFDRDRQRVEFEKEQAWASWFGRNYEKWNQAQWDNETWSGYRDFWGAERQKWTGDSFWQKNTSEASSGSSSNYGEGGYGWQQQNSQEYWDWVSKGTGSKGSSASNGQSTGGWYDRYADSSGAWGSSSSKKSHGYQERGYRYQHQDEDFGSSSQRSGGGYKGASGSDYGKSSENSRNQKSSWGNPWGSRNSRQSKGTDLDFYEVLGLTSTASKSEIKRAYRKKAMEHHPDRNPENSDLAHIKMKEIVVAYTVLKDEDQRSRYDKYGSSGL